MNPQPSIPPYTSASLNMSSPVPLSVRLQHRHSTSSIGSGVSSNIGLGLSASTCLSLNMSTKPLRSSPLAGPPALANTSSRFSDISAVDGGLASVLISTAMKESTVSQKVEDVGNETDAMNKAIVISGDSKPKMQPPRLIKLSKSRQKFQQQPPKAPKSKSLLPNDNHLSLSLRSHLQLTNSNSNPNFNSESLMLSELGEFLSLPEGSREQQKWEGKDRSKNISQVVVEKQEQKSEVVVMGVEENESESEHGGKKSTAKAEETRPRLRKRLSAMFLNFGSSSSSSVSSEASVTASNLIGSPQVLSATSQNAQKSVLGSSMGVAPSSNKVDSKMNSGRKGHARRPSTAPSLSSPFEISSTIPEESEGEEDATLPSSSLSTQNEQNGEGIERPEVGSTSRREKRVRYSSSPVLVSFSSPSSASSSSGSLARSSQVQTPPRQRPQSILRVSSPSSSASSSSEIDRDDNNRPQLLTSPYLPAASPSRSSVYSRTSLLSSPLGSGDESSTLMRKQHRTSVPFPLGSSQLATSPPTSRRQSFAPSTSQSLTSSIKGKTTLTDDSWYTFSQYATTPKFTRLGLAGGGVVMPIKKADALEKGRVIGGGGSVRGPRGIIRGVGTSGGTIKDVGSSEGTGMGIMGGFQGAGGEGTVGRGSGPVDKYIKPNRLDASSTSLPLAHRSVTTLASTSSSSSSLFSRKFGFGFGFRSRKDKEKNKLRTTTTPSISDSVNSSLGSSFSSKSSSLEVSSVSTPSSSASSTNSIIPPSGMLTPPSSVEEGRELDEIYTEMNGTETVKLSKPWKSLRALRSLHSLRSSE